MSKAADVVAAVSDFNKSELKHVEPEVKNPLPTADDVDKEKTEAELMKEIEQGTKLKHVQPNEKIHMPTKEEIEEEKKIIEGKK